MNRLILASSSSHRKALLENAGIEFDVVKADLDERSVEQPLLEAQMEPGDIAESLAAAKALNVAEKYAGHVVIGCDQTLSLDGELLHKPADMEAARRRLLALSGRSHHLNAAVAIVSGGELAWTHMEVCVMTVRELQPDYVGRHLAMVGDAVLSSVGAYQIEGPGIQIFEKMEGDMFSIIGLPLLPLLAQLRKMNLVE